MLKGEARRRYDQTRRHDPGHADTIRTQARERKRRQRNKVANEILALFVPLAWAQVWSVRAWSDAERSRRASNDGGEMVVGMTLGKWLTLADDERSKVADEARVERQRWEAERLANCAPVPLR